MPPPSATPPAPATPAPPPQQQEPVRFPLSWLLSHAASPIQYRAIKDVAKLELGDAERLPYAFKPALTLALTQAPDGCWNNSMLAVPSIRAENFEGIGTITAVRRLVEYGWDKDSPPLSHARRILFRLLAEDDDPAYLFEFASKKADEDLTKRGRQILREAAGAALAEAGYEGDPRLRGFARRAIERVANFLKSPLAAKPWVRSGNKQVLAADAAPPSIYTLAMFAHMPLFRNEHHEQIDRIYQWITQPLPRQESVQLVGDHLIPQDHLVLGDWLPHRNAADADVPLALTWLELMARLNFLRRTEHWCKLFERFLEDRDAQGVWHPHKGMAMPKTTSPFVWPSFPLESHAAGDERWTDVTFRLGLIARLSGRTMEIE